MKVVVIGCTHAGTAAVMGIMERYSDAAVTVYEINDNISFLSCGIALYLADVVKDPQGLFYSSPDILKQHGADVRLRHEVISVDLTAQTLQVKNLESGEVFSDTYDKLVITTGSQPVMPRCENSHLGNIVLSKNYNQAKSLFEKIGTARKVVVVGAGYIGVELAEAFQVRGLEVTLIDHGKRVLGKYLDKPFTDIAEKAMTDRGIRLALGQSVERFKGDNAGNVCAVVTDQGEYEADLVVLCVGFRPNTTLFADQLDMLPNGALKVNPYMQTSRPNVFAAGDACAIFYNPTQTHQYIPLATNAVRMGTLVAMNLKEPVMADVGTQGTSGIKIYEYCISSTGLTEVSAEKYGIAVKAADLYDSYRPEFMPTHEPVQVRVVYDEKTHKILGGQVLSTVALTETANMLSLCIQKGITIEELAFVDFFFQPHFSKPWHFLNTAALKAIQAPAMNESFD